MTELTPYFKAQVDQFHSPRSHPAAWTDVPHLRNVFRSSRTTKSEVTDIEYTANWQYQLSTDHTKLDSERDADAFQAFIEGLNQPKNDQCVARLLLIEDISSVLIQNLLDLFDITPEMFEEHLQSADWDSQTTATGAREKDDDEDLWNTRRITRNYTCLKWFRPLRIDTSCTEVGIHKRSVFLLNPSRGEDDPDEEFELQAISNIWRKHFDMRHDSENLDWSKDHTVSQGLRNGDYIASHERATIWKGHHRGVDIVIVLLDPGHSKALRLSALDSVSQLRVAPQTILAQDRRGKYLRLTQRQEPNQRPPRFGHEKSEGVKTPGNPVGRTSPRISTSSDPEDLRTTRHQVGANQDRVVGDATSDVDKDVIGEQAQPPTLSEKHEIIMIPPPSWIDTRQGSSSRSEGHNENQSPISGVFVRPDDDSEHAKNKHIPEASQELQGSARQQIQSQTGHWDQIVVESSQNKMDIWFRVRSKHVLPQTLNAYNLSWKVESDEFFVIADHVRPYLEQELFSHSARLMAERHEMSAVRRPPFVNVTARTPLQAVHLSEARTKNWLRRATTTKEDLLAWLEASEQSSFEIDAIGPASDIYWIVRNDTLDLISLTNSFIDKSVRLANDENKLVKNLSRWRGMINLLEAEYRRFAQDIRIFPGFRDTGKAWHFSNPVYQKFSELDKEHKFLIEEIRLIRVRLDFALTSLVSAVSVVESRRGISEAESVTKLTELAFIYIPLSFAASFFGMQVRELNPATTSIRWFVVLSILVLLMSYGVRLLIRSRVWVQAIHGMMRSARKYSSLQEREPVPTGKFLRWVAHVIFTKPFKDLLQTEFGETLRDKALLVLFTLVCGFIPLFPVWFNDGLQDGMKLAVSLAICFTVLLMVIGMTATKLKIASTKWMQRRRNRHRAQRMRRRVDESREEPNGQAIS